MNELISTLLENCFLLFISSSLLYGKFLFPYRLFSLLPVFIAKIVYYMLPHSYQSEYISTCINTVIGILVIYLYTKSTIKETILCYITTYIIAMAIQLPYAALSYPLTKITGHELYALLGACYTLIIGIIICSFFNLKHLYTKLYSEGNWITICISNLFAFAVIYALYYKLDKSHYGDIAIFMAISFFILLCVNLLLINQIKYIHTQKEQLNAYKQYLPMLENLINTVRIRQHNYDNKIQSILALLYTYKDYDSLTNEIKKQINIDNENITPDHLLKINLPLVAGFLYHKHCEATKSNKSINYHIDNYNLVGRTPEYVLVEMFGILIDNALEAIRPSEYIDVYISSKDSKITFRTKNHGYILTETDRKNFFLQGYTTKASSANSHSGLGLYHLKNLVLNCYDGSITLWNEDKNILFEITV